MTVVFCPECEHRLKLGARARIGQRIICPKCKANLEVVSLTPPELDFYIPNPATTPKKKSVAEVFCPECECCLKLGTRPRRGQQIICPECEAVLEVVSLDPLELDISTAEWKGKDRKSREQKWSGKEHAFHEEDEK
jgi:lysine biosynthesis protein LysW